MKITKAKSKLQEARERKMWTLAEAAEAVGVDVQTMWRWENKQQRPRAYPLRKLTMVFGMTAEELGFHSSSQEVDLTSSPEEIAEEQREEKPSMELEARSSALITLTSGQTAFLLSLLKEGIMAPFDPKKRRTLEQLIVAISLAAATPQNLLNAEPWEQLALASPTGKINEATLDRFEKLTTLCWRLLKGNELATVEYLLPTFLPETQALAAQPSRYQKAIAGYAAQAHIMKSLVVGHQDNLQAKLAECAAAIEYSRLAENPDFEATALIQQAVAFDYRKQHEQSFQIYQQAQASVDNVSPLLAARILAGLGGAYARCGQQEHQARHYLDQARDLMPTQPETDPSFLYADCGRFTLPLWEGRIYFELDQLDQAYTVFSQVENQADTPERIRTEFLNHMLETSIALGDLDQSLFCFTQAGRAALQLKSDRRQREVRESFQIMLNVWRQDRKKIREVASEVFVQ